MLRPVPMAWIDLLVDRDAAATTIQALGEMRMVELHRFERELPFNDTRDESIRARIDALAQSLQELTEFLPAGNPELESAADRRLASDAILSALEQRFADWRMRARPVAEDLRRARVRLAELTLLSRCLAHMPAADFDLELFATGRARRCEPFIALAPLAGNLPPDHAGLDVISRVYAPSRHDPDAQMVVIGIVDARSLPDLERRYHEHGMRFARVPEALRGSVAEARPRLQVMLDQAQRLERDLRSTLDEINARRRIAGAIWLLDRHRWVHDVLDDTLIGKRFVWLAGWIPADRYSGLVAGLRCRGIPFLARHGPPGNHGEPPVQLRNPASIRRFEAFVRGFGMPCSGETDPSVVLAVIAPLMFGYMFGDIGHGAVLVLMGWLAGRRFPVLELLVPAGLSAMLFGVLYGSLFCDEHLLPALWMRPLDNPLFTLAAPVGFGFLVLTLSMLLAAAQAWWSGRLADWVARWLPLLVAYLAVPVVVMCGTGILVAAGIAGIALLGGLTVQARASRGAVQTAGTIASGVAELVENAMQLAINTLSFARLGAFALAHAGLGSAVVSLSAIPEHGLLKAAVFVVGNVVILVLEGLVVSIQTTRLIMFEFFRRFLTGQGQPFRPLHLPQRLAPSTLRAATPNSS